MTVAQIMSELSERFPDGSHFDISDVQGFFSSLKGQDPDTVYHCIIRNHEYNSFPKLPKIRKYIEKDKIVVTRYEQTEKKYTYYVCDVCKTTFDHVIGFCPNCKKDTKVKCFISEKLNTAFHGHDDCGGCKTYSNRIISSSCKEYATGLKSEVCDDCQCKTCCDNKYLVQNNKPEYLERAGLKT
jgi:hypothetical protein